MVNFLKTFFIQSERFLFKIFSYAKSGFHLRTPPQLEGGGGGGGVYSTPCRPKGPPFVLF